MPDCFSVTGVIEPPLPRSPLIWDPARRQLLRVKAKPSSVILFFLLLRYMHHMSGLDPPALGTTVFRKTCFIAKGSYDYRRNHGNLEQSTCL